MTILQTPTADALTGGTPATTEQLLEAAREMRPRLVERAAWVDEHRRIPEETIEELHSAGFFKYWVPRRFGGSGGSLKGYLQISGELAKSCPATSWVWAFCTGTIGFTGMFLSAEGAGKVYGSSDRTVVAGGLTLAGTATKVEGGYRVTGSWGFVSGLLHSNWVMGNTIVLGENGEPVGPAMAFFPVSDGTIKDTWKVVGMRGTGSNTFSVEDVFVPDDLVCLDMTANRNDLPDADLDPLDRTPLAPLLSVGICGPLLGTAEAILEMVAANVHTRGITHFDFAKQTDSAVVLERLGEAKIRIDGARLLVERAAYELEETTKTTELSLERRAWCRVAGGQAVEDLRNSVDSLMTIAGASAFAEASVLQRFWRDLSVGTRHALVNTRPLYEVYGRAYCGVEPNITQYL